MILKRVLHLQWNRRLRFRHWWWSMIFTSVALGVCGWGLGCIISLLLPNASFSFSCGNDRHTQYLCYFLPSWPCPTEDLKSKNGYLRSGQRLNQFIMPLSAKDRLLHVSTILERGSRREKSESTVNGWGLETAKLWLEFSIRTSMIHHASGSRGVCRGIFPHQPYLPLFLSASSVWDLEEKFSGVLLTPKIRNCKELPWADGAKN